MSNVGQAALTIVGTVVGAYLGGPTGAEIGFSLGSMGVCKVSLHAAHRRDAVSIPLECLYQAAATSMLTRRRRF